MLAPMFRAAPRPLALGAAALAVVLAASGCAGIGQPAPYDSPGINGLVIPTPSVDPDDFVEVVDNPWLALEPGATWSYDVVGTGGGAGTIEAEVLDRTTGIAGLAATAVTTTTDVDGETSEVTRYYAQDDDGNVWLVGLDSSPGVSWRAGEDGAEAGLAMPADPRLGDGWLTYRLADEDGASTTIEEQTPDRVQTRDEAGATSDQVTRNVYEKGVGLVGVIDVDAGWTAQLRDLPD